MEDGPQDLSQRQKHVLVRKAIECGLQLLARQSHFRVYLTAEEIIRHRGPDGEIQRHHRNNPKEPQRRLSMFDSLYESKSHGKTKRGSDNSNDSSKSEGAPQREDTIKWAGKKKNKKRFNTLKSQLQEGVDGASPPLSPPPTLPASGGSFHKDHVWTDINPFKKRHYNHLLSKVSNYRRSSSSSGQSVTKNDIKSIDLQLHIAVSCGSVTNVVLGDINPTGTITEIPLFTPQVRADTGDKINSGVDSNSDNSDDSHRSRTNSSSATSHKDDSNNETTNDANDHQSSTTDYLRVPGQKTDVDSMHSNGDSTHTGKKRRATVSSMTANYFDEYFLRYRGRLEYAIGGEAVESLDKALSAAKAGEISITPEAFEVVNQKTLLLPYEVRDGYYVVKGFVFGEGGSGSGGGSNSKSVSLSRNQQLNSEYLSDRPGLISQASQLKIEPLVPKTRDTSYLNLTVDSNLHYFKYLNRSSLYRLQHSVEGNFPAQFREATIMFIGLGKIHIDQPDGLQKAQRALYLAVRRLVRYEGMLQQFAVDDKGNFSLSFFFSL